MMEGSIFATRLGFFFSFCVVFPLISGIGAGIFDAGVPNDLLQAS
jgi:hypothetical protein